MSALATTLAAHLPRTSPRNPGTGLDRLAYTSDEAFATDTAAVFAKNWLFAGHAADVPNPGDFTVVDILDEQIILWRDRAGTIRAHFNVCRHRGSRLTWESCGTATTLQCPYHQWTYRPDGTLAGARLMGDGFRPADFPLSSVRLHEVGGLLFVCLAESPPSFEPAFDAISAQLSPHRLDRATVVRRERYTVHANWKTLVENNRECYHCRVSHPEFTLSNYDFGLPGDARMPPEYSRKLTEATARWEQLGLAPNTISFPDGQWFRVARMPLKDGYLTETADGTLAAPPMIGQADDPGSYDVGSLRMIGLPNFWAHANADYAMTTRLNPVAPNHTDVEVCFLVRGDATPGVDCDVEKVALVLQSTFEQDIELCESVSAGMRSRGWRAGPYSSLVEASVEMFVDWYLSQLSATAQE